MHTTAPPFTEVHSLRLGPFPRRAFPWWLLPVTIGMLGALALLWRVTEPAPSMPVIAQSAAQPVTVDFGPVNTAIALALATGTPTATPPPTATATQIVTFADQYGYCAPDSPAGAVCVPNRPQAITPTAVPTCYPGTMAMLCQVPGDPDLTSGEQKTI
jgi:hypothetical protein